LTERLSVIDVLPVTAQLATAAAHRNCEFAASVAAGRIFAFISELRFESRAMSANEVVQFIDE